MDSLFNFKLLQILKDHIFHVLLSVFTIRVLLLCFLACVPTHMLHLLQYVTTDNKILV